MHIGTRIAEFCVARARQVTAAMLGVTGVVFLLAAAPSVLELGFGVNVPGLKAVRVDTDPENMLAEDEAVRVFHRDMKKLFSLHDIVVVGVVNETNADGVFNPDSLKRVYELTEFAKTLQWEVDGETEGVVEVDLIAPSTVDNIEQGGLGVVKFEWLMTKPPETAEAARAIREKAEKIPFLEGTLISEDGKALCLYLPLTRKDLSYRVYSELRKEIATFEGDEEFYITGLPVAEDTFGVEMFVQMAVSAPLAMLMIFLLMLAFFRKLVLIISPLIIAMVSVILTMGALIIAGYPVHIMSSMIPIFIMPISVLDGVHIISEFFDRYQKTRDRKATIVKVVDELFMPMLYTSLTSAAGFASLALTPIPPVQIFGIFVAIGILAAWLLTVVFMPAYVMFIKPETLESFGAAHAGEHDDAEAHGWFARALVGFGQVTVKQAKPVLALAVILMAVSAYGISRIEVNDNPVKWFTPQHDIRVADRVLNEHFGGTYMAYLSLRAPDATYDAAAFTGGFQTRAADKAKELGDELPEAAAIFSQLGDWASDAAASADSREAALAALAERVSEQSDAAEGDAAYAWDEAGLFVDAERQRSEIFKDPAVLEYMAKLQGALLDTQSVGKSNSLADVVKTVHRELREGDAAAFKIPDTSQAVAQCLLTYQNSHRAHDLWHFVTPDYRTTSMWVQMSSGDNKDMTHVERAVDAFFAANPPPMGIVPEWFGLTYINVVWQERMVWGMLQAFAGSFLVVFLLMTILFGSALWGLLSMVPLTLTILAIYGAVGLVGKAYDMPVAVLSSLSLGLAVDFAIHFLARARRIYLDSGSWEETVRGVFGEPGRAIVRNIIVIAVGFTPLLFAPLVPYQTVGVLLASILLLSGLATLVLLPALMQLLRTQLFAPESAGLGAACKCVTCTATAVAVVVLVALSLREYWHMSWTTLTWVSLVSVPVFALICAAMSRRAACRTTSEPVAGGS